MIEDEKNCSNDKNGQNYLDPAASLYNYVKELANLKYQDELRREDSLIQQSNAMESAFSFVSAAVVMIMQVSFSNCKLSNQFLWTAFASILATLMLSLIFASITQLRRKRNRMLGIGDLEKFVHDNWQDSDDEAKRDKQYVHLLKDVDESLEKANNFSVKMIQVSMIFFYISLGLCAFWFLVGVAIS